MAESAWERALEQIGDDGHFSIEAALNLFVIAFGPLPGVTGEQDTTGMFDRTIAVTEVLRREDELTAEQLAAVEAYLTPPADALRITIPPVGASRGGVVLAAVSDGLQQAIREVANGTRADIAARLGADMLGDMTINFIPRPASEKPIDGQYPLGYAHAEYAGGVNAGCTITIFDESTTEAGVVLASLLAHEIFHCFQYDGYRTLEALAGAPAWVIEGQASWVGQSLGGASGKYDRFWKKYLTAPQIPLTERAYDAIGFYSHLAETGTDPWSVFRAMWAAGSNNLLIFEQANANTDVFIDSWASGVLRRPALGAAWDTTGPAITADAYEPLTVGVAAGGSIGVAAPFFTNNLDMLEVGADLIHFSVDGSARISDGVTNTTGLADTWFCIAGRECACPNGDPLPIQPAGVLNNPIALAVSGGSEGTVGTARGATIDEFCRETPSPATPRPGTPRPDEPEGCVDCAMSNGDPHLVTVDGRAYDFMAAGEFVMLRTSDGSFELQARQVPLPDNPEVTINTAIALRVGENRLTLTMDERMESIVARLGGQPVDPAAEVDLGSGVTLRSLESGFGDLGSGFVVEFADGTRVHALALFGYGINLLLDPADQLRTSGVGVLGPVAGDAELPALPDGGQVDAGIGTEDYHTALYGPFADAWRVSQETSLFDYAPGETTATFTIPNHPPLDQIVTIDSLTPEQRAAGEAACSRISLEFLREQCIFDVGLTGDTVFAELYDITADVTKGVANASGELLRVVNLYNDGQTGIDLDVYAWTGNRSNSDTGDDGVAFITTVPYGTVSEYFDPGTFINFDRPQWQLSMTPSGEPPVEWAFNLVDTGAADPEPGVVRTLLVTHVDPEDLFFPDATYQSFDEKGTMWVPPEPPPGAGILVPIMVGISYTLPDFAAFASVGDGCLTQPDFPTLGHIVVRGVNPPLLIPAGSHQLTLHEAVEGVDAFAFRCDTPPLYPPTSVDVEPGGRYHLFGYTLPGGTELQTLVLPVGE